MTQILTLAATLAVFIASIYTVRLVDRERYADRASEVSCPAGKVLVLDFSRKFVCLDGQKPEHKD
ncbi:hypothetical protein CC53_gp092 [Rhizobium phage vB_RleS_L338C]|uniref:hypothetical protein n=1 Tax=Rhizobium phage vB_RleS_L338C TaxID=1414737 RepID=UPI0003D81160|nr:hypothetical protein CC53_gp092 [Rhizobium phage vB_RleS_L338C]AHC30509.1 hypothetical protein L338C_092 [Rhizobium phage vB_RleS_L338C]QNH72184.1 hypothetical protein P11VFA_059 [Rhizobium phage P11VFA]